MTTTGMNHFTVLTDDVPATVGFYRDLSVSPRPAAAARLSRRLALCGRRRPCCTSSAGGRGASFGPA